MAMADPDDDLAGLARAELVQITRRMRRAIVALAREVDPDLDPTGFVILGTLADRGEMRSTDLVALHDMDKAVVSRQVRMLTEANMIVRRPDPADARAQLLAIAPATAARVRELRAIRAASIVAPFASWEPTEISDFLAMLRRYNTMVD
jgi:DNA-binding MarR family transcriptional regulator